MNIGQALGYAVTIVNGSEGYTPVAFLDTLASEPVWTIGHGTTRVAGQPVQPGMTCTREQADLWAMTDMTAAAHYVLEESKVPLNEFQLGALISFCYNIGDGNFRASSVLEALNLGLYTVAANRLLEYDEAGGVVRGGLETRRGRERALFLLGCPHGALTLAAERASVEQAAADAETAREDAETDALNQASLDRIAKGK
jgi:lysozyme